MSLDPVAPWWLLVVGAALLGGLCVWCLVRRPGQRTAWTRRLLLVVALLALAAQPSAGTERARADRSNLDVVIAVDNSPSVNAEDYDGTRPRLDGVRADVTALADALNGARFSLVTFASSATQVLPFSSDAAALQTAVSVLEPENDQDSAGSSLDRPIVLLRQVLARDAQQNPERQRVLVLVSDGEQTVDHPPASFAPLRRYVTGGAVLGYGTTRGAPLREYDPNDPTDHTYVVNGNTGERAISKLDESTLRAAAGQLGVPYHHRTRSGGIGRDLRLPHATRTAGGATTPIGRPLYWIPAVALGLLALWEAWALARAGDVGWRA